MHYTAHDFPEEYHKAAIAHWQEEVRLLEAGEFRRWLDKGGQLVRDDRGRMLKCARESLKLHTKCLALFG